MGFNKLIIPFILGTIITPCSETWGQIVPDRTLGLESSVEIPNQTIKGVPSSVIQGGASRGANLFHSFREFNIDPGKAVYFDNPPSINYIFTRITGDKASHLLGRLGVLGNANLLIMNPNGIIFGLNASLDLNGSFVTTTANRVRFADGTSFSSSSDAPESILTISVPIGLDFFGNSQPIRVEGYGHNLNLRAFLPTQRFPNLSSLNVASGKTLALIGGDVILTGGVLEVPSGYIEVAGVERGSVGWSVSSPFNNFNYEGVEKFRDVKLLSSALLDVSGVADGQIQITGNRLSLRDGSGIFSQQVTGENSQIQLNTSSVDIEGGLIQRILVTPENYPIISSVAGSQGIIINIGDTLTFFTPNFIFSEILDRGQGSNITIKTGSLKVTDGGQVISRTFGEATGGHIDIQAQNVQVLSYANIPEFLSRGQTIFSAINSSTFAPGKGGSISLYTTDLFLDKGGTIASTAFAGGDGGNVEIVVNNTMVLSGIIPNVFLRSSIQAVTTGQATGNAGNITIQTAKLRLLDGGEISNSTFSQGNAGNSLISATQFITLEGVALQDRRFPSAISSAGYTATPNLQKFFSIDPLPRGNAGSLTITTPRLNISNGAAISVRNDGLGNAGQIDIKTRYLQLDRGNIIAATRSGKQGNIALTSDLLIFSNNSLISALAGETSDGGNISLISSVLLLDGSQIKVDAFQGNGGNIDLKTSVIFQTLDSSITANSIFGLDGVIAISAEPYRFNVTDINISIQPSFQQVALQSCYNYKQKLTQQGTGLPPASPNEAGSRGYTFEDLIPHGQAVGIERLPNGNYRTLGCNDIKEPLESKDSAYGN